MIASLPRLLLLLLLIMAGRHSLSQQISSLAPLSAIPGQTTDVVIRGINTHFRSGVSIAGFGQGVTVQKFTVQNELTGTATIVVSPSAGIGFRDVQVTTGSEVAVLPGGFEVFSVSGVFRVNLQVLPIETLSLSDFDLANSASQPIIFFANVYNNNVSRTVEISLRITAASKGYLGRMYITNRELSPGSYTKLTNRDFNRYEANGVAGQQFITDIRAAGGFPPDDYTYRLEVREGSILLDEDENTWTVTNQLSNPELIMPGSRFSDEIQSLALPLPLFQWFGQNSLYDFALYKYRPGQTPEEVVRGLPVFRQDDISGSSFLYPNYAEKLTEGQVYAWQVKGKVNSSGGIRYLPSEVFRFTYASSSFMPGSQAVSAITITPREIELEPGQQFQFHATVLDKDGRPVTGMAPVWQMSPDKGTLTQGGLYKAGQGAATLAVLVKAGGVTDFAVVTIKPRGVAAGGGEWMIAEMIRKMFGLPAQ